MNTGRARRREIVLRVREEGRQAFFYGKSIHTNPYNPRLTMDAGQWERGWYEARDAVAHSAQRAKEEEAERIAEIRGSGN